MISKLNCLVVIQGRSKYIPTNQTVEILYHMHDERGL